MSDLAMLTLCRTKASGSSKLVREEEMTGGEKKKEMHE
jgi:hypothetical protein